MSRKDVQDVVALGVVRDDHAMRFVHFRVIICAPHRDKIMSSCPEEG